MSEIQNPETNASEVMESLGEPQSAAQEINNPETAEGTSNNTVAPNNDPLYVQKRLKQQTRQHEREMRGMQEQLADMHNRLSQMGNSASQAVSGEGVGEDAIQKAVNLVLKQQAIKAQEQKNAESQAHLQKQYKELQKHLDDMSDKYDDFDETVFKDDVPITPTMRDYAVTLPKKGKGSAGEVIYHLAKNKDELKRISKLHPLDQAAEMAKLSQALVSGGDSKVSQPINSNPLGSLKNTPITNSSSVTDKTPVQDIRALMRAGKWK